MICFLWILCLFSTLCGFSTENESVLSSFVAENIDPLDTESYEDNLSPFVLNFFIAVQNSKELQNLFNSGTEQSKDYDILYKVMFNAGSVEIKSTDPNHFATIVSDAITEVVDILTPLKWSKAITTSLESTFKDHGILINRNAFEYSQELANNFKKGWQTIGSEDQPDKYIKVITYATNKFINDNLRFSQEDAMTFANYIVRGFLSVKNF